MIKHITLHTTTLIQHEKNLPLQRKHANTNLVLLKHIFFYCINFILSLPTACNGE